MKWNIKNLKFDNNVILAPMAGITNHSFRNIVSQMGACLVYSEMISSEAIIRNNKKTWDMINNQDENNLVIQIFGGNKDTMAKSAKLICENIKNVSMIDINMGCPVPKVAVRSQAGSSLLKDKNKVFEIVNAVVNAVNVPVSVKIRAGWNNDNINCVEIAKTIEKAGASAIAIHPRTREQGYSGVADWNLIKQVKEAVNIPVIGNGDIKNIYDAKRMLEETKCDAIMIGRSTIGNPWIIKECIEYLNNNKEIEKPNYKEILDMLVYHYNLLKKDTSIRKAILDIKPHALAYLKNIPNTKELKKELALSKTEKDFMNCIEKLYNHIENLI